MKAIGFFFAVFFGMLAVFLVATGEIGHWLSSGDPSMTVELPPDPEPAGRKNILEFPFWEVKEGRKRFFIRAELSQESLQGTDAIKELQEISLKNGFIEVPFYASRESEDLTTGLSEGELEELVLEFSRAVYRRGDGLASGTKPLIVHLWEGRGNTNEGTEFDFEELQFSQDEADKSLFEITTREPITILREPFLRVHSPSGLEGVFKGRGGFEKLVFLPPVQTYLSPDAMSLFRREGLGGSPAALPSGSAEGIVAPPVAKDSRKVAITCEGPLELHFDAPPLRASPSGEDAGEKPAGRTRITFQNHVILYQLPAGLPADEKPPDPQGHRFECEKLELEIEDAEGKGPYPSYALATREGGRVIGRFVRDREEYILDGDRLEWLHTSADDARGGGEFHSEVVLSGQPTLKGKDKEFRSQRAVWLPSENRLRLEQVEATVRSAAIEKKVKTWTLNADEAEVVFTEKGDARDRVLSHFVARSEDPRGVVIETLPPAGSKEPTEGDDSLSDRGFQATGQTLTFRERTAESSPEQVILEGTDREPPRITLGTSWIEADRVLLFSKERFTRFEGRVRARLEKSELGVSSGGDSARPPPSSEIRADFLEVAFSDDELDAVIARGQPTAPVSLITLEEPPYRLLAPELRLDATESEAQLLGGRNVTPAGESARIEFDGGEVRAEEIRFEQDTWKCFLEDSVDIRLYSSGKDRTDRPTLQVLAHRAEAVLFEKRRPTATEGALGQLEQQVKKLHATAEDGGTIVVQGKNFILHGEEVTWDSETGELRFFGRESQRIELVHENLRGPIEAREILYQRSSNLVTLRGSVHGQLLQPLVSKDGESGSVPPGKTSPPLVWEFETSVLDLEIREPPGSETVDLGSLRARDKVLLRNRQYGLKLVGDDLVYEHAARRVRIFSKDGRLQKLVHYKPDAGRSPEALEAAGAVNQILAREIWVFHYPGRADAEVYGLSSQLVLVQFEKVVDATFLVSGDSAETWKLDTADRLTLHLDPRADPSTPQILCRAVASGNVVFSSEAYRAEAERAEYEEAERRLRLYGKPVNLIDTKHDRRKKADAVMLRKVGDKILVTYEDPGQAAAGR